MTFSIETIQKGPKRSFFYWQCSILRYMETFSTWNTLRLENKNKGVCTHVSCERYKKVI
jgi:hypothetical protein